MYFIILCHRLMKGSMALVGAGYACIMVSTFARAQGAAARMGYPKDIDTYLLISGKNILSQLKHVLLYVPSFYINVSNFYEYLGHPKSKFQNALKNARVEIGVYLLYAKLGIFQC